MKQTTLIIAACLAFAALSSHVKAEDSVLRTLPTAVQKIGDIRTACIKELGDGERGLEGDDGLATFTISGANAVLVDELEFCGGECHHAINCATEFTHDIAIYVRSGRKWPTSRAENGWKKALSVAASGPTFLDTDDNGKFKALVLRVFAGDKGCQVRISPVIEARQTCSMVLRWDGAKFVFKPL